MKSIRTLLLSLTSTLALLGSIGTSSAQDLFVQGANSPYTLNDPTALTTTNTYVGFSANGQFDQNGGSHVFSSTLYIGYFAGVSGAYNLSGGTVGNGKKNQFVVCDGFIADLSTYPCSPISKTPPLTRAMAHVGKDILTTKYIILRVSKSGKTTLVCSSQTLL